MAWTIAIPERLAQAVSRAFELQQKKGSLQYSKKTDLVRAWIAERAEKEIAVEGATA